MKSDNFGDIIFFEMASHSITHLLLKAGDIVGFGEDGDPECTRCESTLGRFFDYENYFIHPGAPPKFLR